jgi:FMN-dependent NADH-azoreductase
MKILRVICSPRGSSSESYRLSQTIINSLITRHRGIDFIIAERGVGGLAHVDADYAAAVSKRRDPSSAVVASGALLQSERLIRELDSADYDPCALIDALEQWQAPTVTKWIDPAGT